MVPLVFKTSVGLARVPGGFDSHSPPLYGARPPAAVQPAAPPRAVLLRVRRKGTVYVGDHPTSHPAGWLLMGGAASLIYGAFFHAVPMWRIMRARRPSSAGGDAPPDAADGRLSARRDALRAPAGW